MAEHFTVKKSLVTLGLLMAVLELLSAAGVFGSDDVTVRLADVSLVGTHTNFWFQCSVTILNGTSAPLKVTNLFLGPPSLALKISGLDGKELKRVYAPPHIAEPRYWTIRPGDNTYTDISFGFEAWNGGRPSVSVPEGVHTVRVQMEGTLPGSGYTNRLSSNVVEVKVP